MTAPEETPAEEPIVPEEATYGVAAELLRGAGFDEIGRHGRYRTWKHPDDPNCLTVRDSGTAALVPKYRERIERRLRALRQREEG